jgi:hypothetical protein
MIFAAITLILKPYVEKILRMAAESFRMDGRRTAG